VGVWHSKGLNLMPQLKLKAITVSAPVSEHQRQRSPEETEFLRPLCCAGWLAGFRGRLGKLCSLGVGDSLVQDGLDDQLHPGSSGLQAHLSAVGQGSSAAGEEEGKRSA